MITLANIRDWLKTISNAENYYIGKLDNKQDKSIGVYSLRRSAPPITALGNNSTYDIKSVSVLIHWTKNADEAEQAALQLLDSLRNLRNLTINNTSIYCLKLNVAEPVDVGTDDKGVYERVIEFDLYYERID